MRGNALLGDAVHLPGANLDLERAAALADQRGVQRLVEVGLGHGDVVLDPAGDRSPGLVHHAQRRVAVLHFVGDDPVRHVVVELGEIEPSSTQLVVDRVEALDPVVDVGLDAGLLQPALEPLPHVLHRSSPDLDLLLDGGLELRVLVRIEVIEGQILEIALNARHPQPAGDRRVDLEGLARDAPA